MVLQTYKKGLYIIIDISNVPVVRVNEIQLATYLELAAASTDNIVPADVVAGYKGNVVNALVRSGAIKMHRNTQVKMLDVTVELLVRRPNARTLRKLEQAEQVAA
jgi:hypothetical protein